MEAVSYTTHPSPITLYQTPRVSTLILVMISLIWPMLYNGFPLVFSDTGIYVLAATDRYIPVDRPVYYSGFLVYISNLFGLYAVPIVQALCVAYVILLFVEWLAPFASTAWRIFLFGSISILTPAPWLVSWLMPDVFGAMVILIPILLAFAHNQLSGRAKLWLALILLTALISSTGTILFFVVFSVIVALVAFAMQRRSCFSGLIILASVGVLSFILSILPNFVTFGRWTINPGSQAFLASRLVGSGMMQSYLARHCPTEPDLLLCDRQSELQGMSNRVFLWGKPWESSGSPSISQTTGAWRERAADYQALNSRVIAEYATELLRQGVHNSFSNLARTELGNDKADDNFAPLISGPPVASVIEHYYPGEFPRYEKARQQTRQLNMNVFNTIHLGWTWLSYCFLLLSAILAYICKRYELLCVTSLVMFALVLNAGMYGMLVGVVTRYQVKVTWLPTLVAITVLAALHHNKKTIVM
jgi:hypothetical protein